ncbi:MAG TPA: hypothetical protein VL069_03150, partial [Opitutus sp.]|nr:hypothetical protein [Opitutus sp.]
RLVTTRAPRAEETKLLVAAFNEQEALFAEDAAAAEQLLAVGDTKLDTSLPAARLAAATVVASALLNHDEAVMRR